MSLGVASVARAGGLEYAGAGATALARGGAVAARADDPMVLMYNPAGLAGLSGGQLLLDLNLSAMRACVDPAGFYGWGNYGGGGPLRLARAGDPSPRTLALGEVSGDPPRLDRAAQAYYVEPYDRVCMEQHLQPIPQLAATARVSDDLGLGFGLIFPAATPQGSWGDDYGWIRGASGAPRPAATRYMLIDSGTLGVFPTVGAGYRLDDALRVGAAFDWGVILVDTTTMARIGGGTGPDDDVLAHLRARDLFVPGLTLSAHLVPFDGLDLVAAFRYQADVDAAGKLDLTTGIWNALATPRTTHGLHVDSVSQSLPWKLRGAVRYADRFAPRSRALHDPLAEERWDLELDVEYQLNARNDAQRIDYRSGQYVEFQALDGAINTAAFPDPGVPDTVIEKHWQDQVSVRLGGSYHALPGRLGIHAGVHYEDRGVDPDYMQVDFWPLERVGLHGGLVVRMFGDTDFVLAYAHIFQETLVVAAPEHEDAHDIYVRYVAGDAVTAVDKRVGAKLTRAEQLPVLHEPASASPDGQARVTQVTTKTSSDEPPWIVNAGTYRSHLDLLAIGLHSRF